MSILLQVKIETKDKISSDSKHFQSSTLLFKEYADRRQY